MKKWTVFFLMGLLALSTIGHAKISSFQTISGTTEAISSNFSHNVQCFAEYTEIKYNRFSVDKREVISFMLPSDESILILRVDHGKVKIKGKLSTNGRLIILASNGVNIAQSGSIFSNECVIGAFKYSSKETIPQHFKEKPFSFFHSAKGICNRGKIVSKNSDLLLVGKKIVSTGYLCARSGKVFIQAQDHLASGHGHVPEKDNPGRIILSGEIEAQHLQLSTPGRSKKKSLVIKNCQIDLTTANQANNILLDAGKGDLLFEHSSLNTRQTSMRDNRSVDTICFIGNHISILKKSMINLHGDYGKIGSIMVGKNFNDPDSSIAKTVLIDRNSSLFLHSNGFFSGGDILITSLKKTHIDGDLTIHKTAGMRPGGNIYIHSDKKTVFKGNVRSNLTEKQYDRGTVFISGKQAVDCDTDLVADDISIITDISYQNHMIKECNIR